jgi:hypothetical protein
MPGNIRHSWPAELAGDVDQGDAQRQSAVKTHQPAPRPRLSVLDAVALIGGVVEGAYHSESPRRAVYRRRRPHPCPPYPRCCDERAAAGHLRLGVTYGTWNKAAYISWEVRNAQRNSGYMLHSSLAYTGPGAVVGVGVLLAGAPLLFLARRHYR